MSDRDAVRSWLRRACVGAALSARGAGAAREGAACEGAAYEGAVTGVENIETLDFEKFSNLQNLNHRT